jgi:uncharacterized protein
MRIVVVACLTAGTCLLAGRANAASFDCSKAQSPFERKVCSTPALSNADDLLAAVYKARLRDFIVPDFIRDSQRAWLGEARQCLPETAKCIKEYAIRTATLASYAAAKVYTDYGRDFDHEGVTLVLTERQDGTLWLDWYGRWMPDAYKPKPFPDGFLAFDGGELVEKNGHYGLGFHPDASITVSEEKISFGGDGMELTLRQGPIVRDFKRVR